MPKTLISTTQYAKDLFQDSLVTGVPQIVQTRNIPRKILKTLVLLGCMIGFVYQTTEFLKIFWSYPTVLDIDVEYPQVIQSPAITFCNLNGIRRIPFCQKFPDDCQAPVNRSAFCGAFPQVCNQQGNEYLKFPFSDALQFERYCSPEELANLGHTSDDMLKHCKQLKDDGMQYAECGSSRMRMAMSDGNSGYRNCYTLFSSSNSSTLTQYQLPVPKKKDPLFHMAFELEPEQYFRPDRQVGGIIGIHSPNSIINPFYEGFVIQPGRLYTVHLKVVEEKLLPSPYETQCKDYKTMWKLRGGRGPLSQEMCLAECVFNVSMSQCHCVIPDVLYPHQERICTEDELDCFHINMTECYNDCPQPCELTDFEYDVQERKLEDMSVQTIEDFYGKPTITQSRAAVLIFLKRPEIVVYSHRPQYEDIEVFSFLGGYVGMWLGISLTAVFDFFESIALITNHWIRRRLVKQ